MINSLVESFDTIGLNDLDKVKLLNRRDTKYVIPYKDLEDLLIELKRHYRILAIGDDRTIDYDTIYYDTENLDLYSIHQNGKRNRFKVRYRIYRNNNQSYLELKMKNNKSRTVKVRRKIRGDSPPDDEEVLDFVRKKIIGYEKSLGESLRIGFTRITLVDRNYRERITIDSNLTYGLGGRSASFPMLAIIEVKQDQFDKGSPIISLLRGMKFHPERISKYCLGIYTLSKSGAIKRNLMKSKMHLLGKRIKLI